MSDFHPQYHESAALSHRARRNYLFKSVVKNLTYLNLPNASKGDPKFIYA